MTEFFNRSEHKERRRELRSSMPKAEVILWARLKGRQLLGIKFRRQYSIGKYIVDFYAPSLHLAIETDVRESTMLSDTDSSTLLE